MIQKIALTISLLVLASISAAAQASTATAAPSGPSASTASTAEKKRGPVFRPTKDQIKQVQQILKDKKLYTAEASGKYDDDTRAGIKSFQKDNGLKQTGTLNRATLEKFGVTLTDSQKAISVDANSFATGDSEKTGKSSPSKSTSTDGPKRPAPFRAGKDQITAAQNMLRGGKMLTGGEDGKLDDTTREGLKKYQQANSLSVTGTLNAATLNKMGIALTEKQKEQVAAQAAYDAAKRN